MNHMLFDASSKRFYALLLAPVFLIAENKLGLALSAEERELVIIAVMTYIGGSHAKEAVVKRAEVAAKKAADEVKPEDAPAIIKQAIEEGKQ